MPEPSPAPHALPPEQTSVALPSFQPGLWEYRRTLVTSAAGPPRVSKTEKCGNPSADIQQKTSALENRRCRFLPLKKTGTRYISTWICPTPNGPMTFRDVLTAKGENAYEDLSEARTAQHVTRSKIEAARLGDCPAGATVAPATTEQAATPPPQP